MPELTVMHIGLLALMLVAGGAVGWLFRADRCAKEKIAVNASWQEQRESQQSEHNRLAEQNKSLMEQISQYQASHKDYTNRAKELSDSLKEAFARRDELQRQLKDMRGNLEVAIAQRDRLRGELKAHPQVQAGVLKEKDDKIFKLSRELTSWQSRVPPLVERFQARDREARALADELDVLRKRLQALEDLVKSDQTRIEPVDAGSLPDGGDASNEPLALTAENEAVDFQELAEADVGDDESAADEADEPVSTDPPEEAVVAIMHHDTDPQAATNPIESQAASTVDVSVVEQQNEVLSVEDFVDPEALEDPESSDDPETARESAFSTIFSAPQQERDDLKQIKGIGPSIEKTLNDLGVYRFHQIAEMSEYDIDRIAQQLKGFRSRIYREDWIGQARDLQYQKTRNRH